MCACTIMHRLTDKFVGGINESNTYHESACFAIFISITRTVGSVCLITVREPLNLMKLTRKITSLLLATVFSLAACATSPPALPPDISATPSLSEITSGTDRNCPVWIYRTNTFYHSGNPEKPFVFVNELQVGGLGVSNTMCLNLKPGIYQVSIKEPIMFMPGPTSGALTVEPKNGEVIYIRYSKEMGGVFVVGAAAGTTSKTSLSLSDRESWMARK